MNTCWTSYQWQWDQQPDAVADFIAFLPSNLSCPNSFKCHVINVIVSTGDAGEKFLSWVGIYCPRLSHVRCRWSPVVVPVNSDVPVGPDCFRACAASLTAVRSGHGGKQPQPGSSLHQASRCIMTHNLLHTHTRTHTQLE